MPAVHMIHGFVGAGKTTFSKKLERETRAVRFTPDEWICDLYGNNPPAESFDERQDRIYALIRKVAERVLAAGADVILDYGFWWKTEREETRRWAESIGAGVKLYALQCPDDVMDARTLARTAEMPEGALRIDENAIRIFRQKFEAVDPAVEECVVVRTG